MVGERQARDDVQDCHLVVVSILETICVQGSLNDRNLIDNLIPDCISLLVPI